jgi:hypothetical protein
LLGAEVIVGVLDVMQSKHVLGLPTTLPVANIQQTHNPVLCTRQAIVVCLELAL